MNMASQMSAVICGLFWSVTACADQQEKPERYVVLEGKTLTLTEDQQNCVLRGSGQKTLPLKMPWPCQFTVDHDGKPHVETFRNVPIVIVLHVEPAAAGAKKCESQYRAVRLINGRLEPSVISHSAACYTGVGDQKDYTGVFEW